MVTALQIIKWLFVLIVMPLLSYLIMIQPSKDQQITTVVPTTEYPIILYWTLFFGRPWLEKEGLNECGEYKCYFTADKSLFYNSSLVIFHGRSHFIPDILSLYKYHYDRPQEQRWVYVNAESPVNNQIHYFLKKTLFNWTMTYRQDSDVIGGSAEVLPGKYQEGFDPLKNYLEGKDIEATAVISNCLSIERLMSVRELSKYMKVNLMGLCALKFPCTAKERDSQIQRSKFYLAFENSICKDYITEKTYRNAFSNKAVPVIMSGANLSNPLVIPQGSYIDASNFNSAKELAHHLQYIGSSKELYNKFFEWREHWTIRESSFAVQRCHLCETLHKSNPSDKKVYEDLSGLYDREKECKPYPW